MKVITTTPCAAAVVDRLQRQHDVDDGKQDPGRKRARADQHPLAGEEGAGSDTVQRCGLAGHGLEQRQPLLGEVAAALVQHLGHADDGAPGGPHGERLAGTSLWHRCLARTDSWIS